MEVSIRLETIDGRQGMAVYAGGRCIGTGLTEAEASALMARILNRQFEEPQRGSHA